jgi:WD40 repeat protein/serine/threonine protein kinase
MAAPSPCPPTERLQQLLTGEPSATEQAELIAHLDHCSACQQTLDKLVGADPALLGAASALQVQTYAEEAPLRRVLVDLGSDANPTLPHRPHARAAWVQSLLRPADSPDALGQLDSYLVTELLGQGGMGVVLKGFDAALRRWVAIKLLAPDLASDSVARQRFAREARAAAAVRHEHVVVIHAVSELDGLPYFVMEYVGGGSVQDYLDRHGPPDWRSVARLGAEIAAGLAAAHSSGLIHRDVKPSNILLQELSTKDTKEPEQGGTNEASLPASSSPSWIQATAKISDFGLARIANESRLTRTGVVTGTPMYMAPEQALCEPLDPRADLFSLGSVLYALCTGREPFPAGTPIAVLRQVCEATPRPIRELNPAVPVWLAAIVERLHAKRPADRFATAAEVAELLRYNLAHPEQPRLVAGAQPVGRLRRDKRRLAGLAAVAALLLAGGWMLSDPFHWTDRAGGVPDGVARANGVVLRATLRGHQAPVWSVAFAPDGQTLATGSDDTTLRIWDAATAQERATLPGHSSAVLAVAFGHSGKFLVSGSGDGALHLWDVAARSEQSVLPHTGGNVRRLALSPDDKTLAVGSNTQGVELWDLDRRTLRQAIPGHHVTILALCFAPGGKPLATGDAGGYIRFWEPQTGAEQTGFVGDPLGVRALAFSPDGRILASAGSGDRDVKLWNTATHELVATLSGYETGVQCLAVSPDGRFLATGSRDGSVKLWDLPAAAALATLPAHQGTVWSVDFSPDSRTLATAGEDRLAQLWDLGNLGNARP